MAPRYYLRWSPRQSVSPGTTAHEIPQKPLDSVSLRPNSRQDLSVKGTAVAASASLFKVTRDPGPGRSGPCLSTVLGTGGYPSPSVKNDGLLSTSVLETSGLDTWGEESGKEKYTAVYNHPGKLLACPAARGGFAEGSRLPSPISVCA